MITEMISKIEDEAAATKPLLDDPLGFSRLVYAEACDADPRLATRAATAFDAYAEALDALKRLHPDEDGIDTPRQDTQDT